MHHIAIGTKNLTKMISFYESLPDLKLITLQYNNENKIRSAWFQNLNQTILMLEENEINKAPLAIVFQFSADTDLSSIRNLICKKTDYTIYFFDPDKNMLGYSSYPKLLVNY